MDSTENQDLKLGKINRTKPWQAIVDDFIKSGLSQSEYARRKGLKLSSLSYHFHRKAKPKSVSPHFIPVTIKESEPKGGDFKVFMQGGLEIRIPSDFNEKGLSRLMKTLRGAGC